MTTYKTAKFWTERLRTHGHTGWSDPLVYAYDQMERLSIVAVEVDNLNAQPQQALDFGCGTGDFSRLLLAKGYRVWGYDPFVDPKIDNNNFQYLGTHNSLDSIGELGLALSVTVLDHILDAQTLNCELRFLRSKMCRNGFLLMVEYALDKTPHSSNAYQAFRTVEVWTELLAKCGWEIAHMVPVPHPTQAPSTGYSRYSSGIIIRLTRRLLRFHTLQPLILPVIAKYATRMHRQYGIGNVHQSPLKLILCRPN